MSLGNSSAKKKQNNESMNVRKLVTPKFRVAHPHVFKPYVAKGKTLTEQDKYHIIMLFAKDADITPLKKALLAAKVDEYGKDKSKWPAKLESPIADGDAPEYADKVGYKGHWAVKASSNQMNKPGVVDQDLEPILNPADLYPGCYARASVFARAWEYGARTGVHFVLDHVQKMGDGKPFGGKKPADQVFAPVTSDDDEDEVVEDDDDDFM